MQRIRIQRMRVQSLVLIALTALMTALWVTMVLVSGASPVRAAGALICAGGLIYALWFRRRARRALEAFEAEHGEGAGIQPTRW
ncbi:hypothetical protein SAMN04488590_3421 [Microbacterium sp. 77mftsu3.1]|nr:hypothetical protein SAMN04488590_3421 [Microbacterium sp. 77mftsu3.1]